MRMTLRRTVLCLSGLLAMALALPAHASRSCAERIEFGQLYECEFSSEATNLVTDGSILFEALDGETFTATLDLEGAMSVAYCTCKTKPSNPPGFGLSKSFECVTNLGGEASETMEGLVIGNGNRISKGQVWSANPATSSFLRLGFTCGKAKDGGEDDDPSALSLRVKPSSWNTKWLDKGGGTVSASIRGDGHEAIDPGSVLLTGSDPAAAALAPVATRQHANRFTAQFQRSAAIATLLEPKKGETHTIFIDFLVNGVPTTLAFDVRVTGK